MRKRLLSWLLVLVMIFSLIPSTLITSAFAADNTSAQASGQAGKTTVKLTNNWPKDLSADITDVTVTNTIGPGSTLTVGSGKTLIFHGSGFISNGTANQTLVIVEKGGHLVLDELTIQNNGVASTGAIYVKSGGLLDLGYNDQSSRHAPSITGNTVNTTARNLVIEDGATVHLNAAADKAIGVSYKGNIANEGPKVLLSGGRYTISDSDVASNHIVADDSASLKTIQAYDNILLRKQKAQILVVNPANYFAVRSYPHLQQHAVVLRTLGDVTEKTGSASYQYHLSQSNEGSALSAYDIIFVLCPYSAPVSTEVSLLKEYLKSGGTVFLQAEDSVKTNGFWDMNAYTSKLAAALGTPFKILEIPSINDVSVTIAENNKWTTGMSSITNTWRVFYAGPIVGTNNDTTTIFSSRAADNEEYPWLVDMLAGERDDGSKWGNIFLSTDANMWTTSHNYPFSTWGYQSGHTTLFAKNLVNNSIDNRTSAACGYNPNSTFTAWQATTTTTTTTETTDYRTPYAALQKAVETSTITLLTESRKDTGLTPTRDELLFEKATLAYEAGSKYDGSTIHADTAGVYLDITKTGEVNLRSGTVTVTPKDKNYVLTLGGTMNETGTQIPGGYKITSTTPYQLIADDPTSPILPQNGGKASIVIPNAGESVTVDYGGGKTVTYTAKENNEKVYLGWYQVNKNTPASATWTDRDKAWYGHPFTTTLGANTGFEVNGEKLTVADTVQVGNYTMVKKGDAVQDPTDKDASWTTYESTEKDRENKPKVTIKQKHLHTGNVDRNGEAIVIVNDVRANITIGAADGAVNAASPTIYVVGVGQRAGQADVQLWEYTTTRNTKDGNLQKPVNGWPWEKWKVVKAASATGTQLDYTNNKNGFKDNLKASAGTTGLNTTNPTAEYDVDLFRGDKVVVFYYDWNMVDVTIKATDANGNPIPDYTDQVVEYEIGKQTTITAPNLIGYQPVAGQNTKDFTPSETNKEITFQYEKTTGNLIYKAVYVDGAGVNRELGTFSGGTLVQGQAPNKSAQYAPRFDNYELADKTADGVASAESYTGTDITVTYTYKAKVKTIPVEAYVDSTSGVRLLNDTTTYKDITTGQTITVTAPDIAGYKVKGAASQTVFVTNDTGDEQKVVFLYEKDNDNDAYVLVKLVDSSNGDKLISSYQVPGVKDKAQLIKAPDAPYANGGTGDDVIDLIKNGQPIKARTNTFTYGSQTFTGWNTADNGVGGTLYQATDTITVPAGENSVTLYAQWGKANFAHSTTITYLPNDGTGDTNKKVVTVGSNTDANFKANLLDTNPFSVTGWTFGGWHKASNGVGSEPKRLGAEIDATAGTPQTWYAQWYRVNADGSITVPGEDGNPNTPDNCLGVGGPKSRTDLRTVSHTGDAGNAR